MSKLVIQNLARIWHVLLCLKAVKQDHCCLSAVHYWLAQGFKQINLFIFADDTNIFYFFKEADKLKKITNKELDKVLKICAAQNVVIDLKKTNKLQDNSLTQETKYKRRRTICKIEKKNRRLNLWAFLFDETPTH